MKILVTGATGFVGNHVINSLVKLNHEIIATSRNEKKAKSFSWYGKVKYIHYDINNKAENLFEFFRNPDILIHLAWEGLPNYKSLVHIEKNLLNNMVFIRNIIFTGLKRINVIGTCLEYGQIDGKLSEDKLTNPITSYGLAKDFLRRYVELLRNEFEFEFNWIRLFYMYGKGQNPKSIISQLDKALNNKERVFNMSGGEQERDYLSVEKVAEYIVKIVQEEKGNGIVNCCSGKPISIKKFVENYLNKKGKKIELNLGYYPYPDYEPMSFWGDNSKLMKILINK